MDKVLQIVTDGKEQEPLQNETKHFKGTIQKMEAVRTLTDDGYEVKEALSLVGYAPKSISPMQTRFHKYLLTTPKLLKKSKVAAEKILDDFIEEKQPDAKHALRLIELQQERLDPVVNKHLVQSQSLNVSITADQRSDIIRSLRRYKGCLPPDIEGIPQDVVGAGDNEVDDSDTGRQDVTIDI